MIGDDGAGDADKIRSPPSEGTGRVASGNGSGTGGARPYRKRRPLPALIVIGVLALGALGVWVHALVTRLDVDAVVRCDPPPTPAQGVTYTPIPHAGLDDRAPIPPDKVVARVLNASETRGQGSIATTALRELGFTQMGEPAADPAYDGTKAKCRGQIRFGDNGAAAARTLSLVVPCAELVKDNRKDATVDLTTGTTFGDIRPKAEARQILQQLSAWSQQHQGGGGGEQSAGASAPVVDQTLLASARDLTC